MEWNEVKTIQFIELYEKKQLLWFAKHPQYYNKTKRNDAFEEISKEIGFTSEECKKKINCLLSAMRREKAKIKKSFGTGKGADEIYKSSWYAYNHMKFLWDKDTPCETTSSIPIEEETDIHNIAVTEIEVNTPSPSSSLPPPSQSKPTTPPSSKKKRKNPEDHRLDKAFELLTAVSVTNSDESQHFGNFVANKLRKYSARTQSAIQHAFMGIFLNADNGMYEQPLPYTYDYPSRSTASNMYQVSNSSSTYTTPTPTPTPPESSQVHTPEVDNEDISDYPILY